MLKDTGRNGGGLGSSPRVLLPGREGGLAWPWQITGCRTSGQRIAPIPAPFHLCSCGLWGGVRAEEKWRGQVLESRRGRAVRILPERVGTGNCLLFIG